MSLKSVKTPMWISRIETQPNVWFLQNSCITSKLRDFLYVVLNHPHQSCRKRPRMLLLKRKVQNLHTIITRICYRVRTSESGLVCPCRSVCPCVCVSGRIWCFSWTTVRQLILDTALLTMQRTGFSCWRKDEQKWLHTQSGNAQHADVHISTCRACSHPPTAADTCLAHIGGCIPAWPAELSTGNLLNANHTMETLPIIKLIWGARERGLTAARWSKLRESLSEICGVAWTPAQKNVFKEHHAAFSTATTVGFFYQCFHGSFFYSLWLLKYVTNCNAYFITIHASLCNKVVFFDISAVCL